MKALVIKANEDSEIGLTKLSSDQTLEYSLDNKEWNTFNTTTSINLESGKKMYVRGILSGDNTLLASTRFKIIGNVSLDGDCRYIWNYKNPDAPLKKHCGNSIFRDCTGITSVGNILPSLELVEYCYYQMFQGCTSLQKAPELPAPTLVNMCYYSMFNGCNNFNYIKCLAEDIPTNTCTSRWLNGVASTGTFIKSPNMNDWPTGIDGIPEGWTILNDGEE